MEVHNFCHKKIYFEQTVWKFTYCFESTIITSSCPEWTINIMMKIDYWQPNRFPISVFYRIEESLGIDKAFSILDRIWRIDKLDSDEELLFLDNVDMVCFLKLLSGNSMLGSITIGIFLLYILWFRDILFINPFF